jgi:hypothetical protein
MGAKLKDEKNSHGVSKGKSANRLDWDGSRGLISKHGDIQGNVRGRNADELDNVTLLIRGIRLVTHACTQMHSDVGSSINTQQQQIGRRSHKAS